MEKHLFEVEKADHDVDVVKQKAARRKILLISLTCLVVAVVLVAIVVGVVLKDEEDRKLLRKHKERLTRPSDSSSLTPQSASKISMTTNFYNLETSFQPDMITTLSVSMTNDKSYFEKLQTPSDIHVPTYTNSFRNEGNEDTLSIMSMATVLPVYADLSEKTPSSSLSDRGITVTVAVKESYFPDQSVNSSAILRSSLPTSDEVRPQSQSKSSIKPSSSTAFAPQGSVHYLSSSDVLLLKHEKTEYFTELGSDVSILESISSNYLPSVFSDIESSNMLAVLHISSSTMLTTTSVSEETFSLPLSQFESLTNLSTFITPVASIYTTSNGASISTEVSTYITSDIISIIPIASEYITSVNGDTSGSDNFTPIVPTVTSTPAFIIALQTEYNNALLTSYPTKPIGMSPSDVLPHTSISILEPSLSFDESPAYLHTTVLMTSDYHGNSGSSLSKALLVMPTVLNTTLLNTPLATQPSLGITLNNTPLSNTLLATQPSSSPTLNNTPLSNTLLATQPSSSPTLNNTPLSNTLLATQPSSSPTLNNTPLSNTVLARHPTPCVTLDNFLPATPHIPSMTLDNALLATPFTLHNQFLTTPPTTSLTLHDTLQDTHPTPSLTIYNTQQAAHPVLSTALLNSVLATPPMPGSTPHNNLLVTPTTLNSMEYNNDTPWHGFDKATVQITLNPTLDLDSVLSSELKSLKGIHDQQSTIDTSLHFNYLETLSTESYDLQNTNIKDLRTSSDFLPFQYSVIPVSDLFSTDLHMTSDFLSPSSSALLSDGLLTTKFINPTSTADFNSKSETLIHFLQNHTPSQSVMFTIGENKPLSKEPPPTTRPVNGSAATFMTSVRPLPDTTTRVYPPCLVGYMRCDVGICIRNQYYCDGQVNCPDGSDEKPGCSKTTLPPVVRPTTTRQPSSKTTTAYPPCLGGYVRCDVGTCIRDQYYCDGRVHCPDRSDEKPGCKCGDDQIRCSSGQCIYKSLGCDGYYHCYDKSDEYNCTGCKGFQCASGLCLWKNARCDYKVDCPDLSDEMNCPFKLGYRRCSNSLWVVASDWCDGVDDCYDNSDETSCTCNDETEISCPGNGCIRKEWKCDGHKDCINGTDESDCGHCSPGDFQCSDYKCVDNETICDGKNDCKDGTDETNCFKLEGGNVSTEGQLQARRGAVMLPVCSTDWTDELSDEVCQTLGYQKSSQTDHLPHVPTGEFYQLTTAIKPGFSLLSGLNKVSTCSSGKTMQLTCMPKECGTRSNTMVAYIAGGELSTRGRWPWVASLSYLGKPICAAAIINDQWLVTAGHCIVVPGSSDYSRTPFYMEAMVGSVKRLRDPDVGSEIIRAKRVVVHPQYEMTDIGPVLYDVALVQLERKMMFSSFIQPVCLPDLETSLRNCYVAGWGMIGSNQAVTPEYLREAKLHIWSDANCEDNTVPSETKVNVKITLCAGYSSGIKSTCQGDSGGPLMCEDDRGRWQLSGVTSSGASQCGVETSRADRFTRVSAVVDWIRNVTNSN